MSLLTGQWKGHFIYGEDYPETMKGRKTNFLIELEEDNNGYFQGVCQDEDSPFNQPATITGFIDEGFVSFIKKYPYYYGTDDDGDCFTDSTLPTHEIHYAGELSNNIIEGIFEFGNLSSFVKSDEIYEGGSFWMVKEDK